MTSPTPVWFITAASSGFGHEMAISALKLNHKVVATARNASKIQDLADMGAHTLSFDVTSSLEDIQATAKEVFDKFGRVDYLINTAGYILEGAAEEISAQEMYDCFNTNVFGAMTTIKAFLPHMRGQSVGTNGFRGTVVTFGSLASWLGGASYSVYSMTKASASMLAESLKPELEPFKIRATVIEPGYFRTGFLNPGTKMMAKGRIDAYEDESTPTGQTRNVLGKVDGNQPGDVKKGADVSVAILTGTGVAEGRELPVRVVLGSDVNAAVRGKTAEVIGTLDEWRQVFESTDYPKGQ